MPSSVFTRLNSKLKSRRSALMVLDDTPRRGDVDSGDAAVLHSYGQSKGQGQGQGQGQDQGQSHGQGQGQGQGEAEADGSSGRWLALSTGCEARGAGSTSGSSPRGLGSWRERSPCRSADAETAAIYNALSSARPADKRTIKVDLCPTVSAATATQVFHDVARLCGFVDVRQVSERVLVVKKLRANHLLCGPKQDVHYDFCLMQELVVRDYGRGSTRYAALYLTWLQCPPKLVRQGSASGLNKALQLQLPLPLPGPLGKKAKVSKRATDFLVEEVVGRWRATLFQNAFALEAATLDNHPDAPWQSLDPDEVDWVDSDDELTGSGKFQPLPPPPPARPAQAHVAFSAAPLAPAPITSSQPTRSGAASASTPATSSAPASASALPSAPGHHQATQAAQQAAHERLRRSAGGSSGSASGSGSGSSLARPKSALKFPCDRHSSRVRHDRRKPRSVQFTKAAAQVQELDISCIHREARMAAGCKVVNQFGEVRPMISTRSGCLIYVDTDDDVRQHAQEAQRERAREARERQAAWGAQQLPPPPPPPPPPPQVPAATAQAQTYARARVPGPRPKQTGVNIVVVKPYPMPEPVPVPNGTPRLRRNESNPSVFAEQPAMTA